MLGTGVRRSNGSCHSRQRHWKDDGGIDPVTETDKANEVLVTKTILHHFPRHRVIGEEAVAAGSGVPAITAADPPTWYIDPIDGTQ